jgi:tetratricopeptide (TPR) repeat protein
LREAAALVEKGRFGPATQMLRDFINAHPQNANALFLLAETARKMGSIGDTETLLARCVGLAPDFAAARYAYATVLLLANKPEAAFAQSEALTQQYPENPLFRVLRATSLEALGDHPAASALWRALVEDYPFQPKLWERYARTLRALGMQEACVAAHRRIIEIQPSSGIPWWNLADLKTFRFSDYDIEQMEARLARTDLAAADRTYLHFALGKAYADLDLYDKSFANYARAHAIQRLELKYDPDLLTRYVARCKTGLTADLFRRHAASGCSSHGPIFIVGMARSGSTLVEQILASHSQIEATRELVDLPAIAQDLGRTATGMNSNYPAILTQIDAAELTRLGERYLEAVRPHRRRGRQFIIDKNVSNYAHIGLIQLILPNARIVDARRHPLACGFSNFAQIFIKDKKDASSLTDIGRHYRDYVELMAHFDDVLPGRVHRIFYEDLVADPEREIRRLLHHLGLSFEPACLRFHETRRTVLTVSSEQVRRPMYKDSLERWKQFEPWLGPLKNALGPVLDSYPDVPAFD